MALPVAGAILTGIKSDLVGKATEGVQGLFGDTSTDKARKTRAASLLNSALNGDPGALRQLTFDAFEPRRGMPGDNRTPADGKYSPDDSRRLARTALQAYVRAGGKLPDSLGQYAERISAQVEPKALSVAEELAEGVTGVVARAAVTAAEDRAKERAREYLPYVLAGLAVLALFMFASSRRAGS